MNTFIGLAEEALGREFDRDRVLVVGNAQRKRSVFLYAKSGRDPVVVARLPGHRATEDRCRAEQEGFRAFANCSVPNVIVPKVFGEVEFEGFTCFLQEVVKSRQWQGRIPNFGTRPRRRDFLQATEYLIEIFGATQRDSDEEWPHCFQHGDYWMGNLGQRGADLVLYDFEYAKVDGAPLHDLFHFCLYYQVALRNRGLVGMEVAGGTYDRGQEKRVFNILPEDIHRVFIDAGSYRDLVGDCIKRYCSACMISEELAAGLLQDFVECRIENNRGIRGFEDGWERAVFGD